MSTFADEECCADSADVVADGRVQPAELKALALVRMGHAQDAIGPLRADPRLMLDARCYPASGVFLALPPTDLADLDSIDLQRLNDDALDYVEWVWHCMGSTFVRTKEGRHDGS